MHKSRILLKWPPPNCIALATLLIAQAIPARAQSNPSAATPEDVKPAATRVVTDEEGRKVSVPLEPRRVVSLAPNLTETIYALGLEDKLAGDTDYCDTPPAAKLKPHIGGPQNPSLEAIVALRPDLILVAEINQWDMVHALDHLRIPVYAVDPQTVEGMLASTRRIADLLGADEKGAALAGRLQARLDALKEKLADRPMAHVLFVVWMDPLITIGQNTFISDALRWAGAESAVMSEQKWPHVSFEEIVRVQPDYIVLTPDHQESNAAGLAELRARSGWRSLEAVEAGHVIVISAEVNRPSPGMVDAIEQAARMLHPEAFTPESESQGARTDAKPQQAPPTTPQQMQHVHLDQECAACAH